MSFTMATDPADLTAVVGVLGVVLGSAEFSRWRAGADPGTIVAHCADGSVIGARERGVRRRPAHRRWLGGLDPRVSVDLERGDLAYLRVREGRAGEAPWIVEGLDRDPDPFVLHWEFATPEEALAAYRLIEERIAEPPRDAAGGIVRLDDLEFDARLLDGAARSAGAGA